MQAELFRSQEEKKFILIHEMARHRLSNVRESHACGSEEEEDEGGIKQKKRESQFSLESSSYDGRKIVYLF